MLDRILGENPEIRRIQSSAARALLRLGLNADSATAIAVIAGAASGLAFASGAVRLGIVMLAVSGAMDAIDGTMARESGSPTPFGGVSDLVADRVVESIVIVGIAWRYPELYLPALILVASWYVNITVFLAVGAALERRGPKLIDYPPGILERTEALIFFIVLAAIESSGPLRPAGPLLCYAMTAMEAATGAQRFWFGIKMLRTGSSTDS